MKKKMLDFGNSFTKGKMFLPFKNICSGVEMNTGSATKKTVLLSVSDSGEFEYHRLVKDNVFYVMNVKTQLFHKLKETSI